MMVIGYHLILTAYGFWLPNDPRGSWSDFVGGWELARFGKATTVIVRQSIAKLPHDHTTRATAKRALKYPPISFTGEQAREIGGAFGAYATSKDIRILACAVLPEHAHLVIERSALKIESIAVQLKAIATRKLLTKDLHPFQSFTPTPKMWSRGQWSVYLNTPRDIERSIDYVENNPLREGKRKQNWSFISPFSRDA